MCQISSVVAFSVLPALRGGGSLLYEPGCHVLMKCLLPVAVPGRIQLNHNALVYAFTNKGPATVHIHTKKCYSLLLSADMIWTIPTSASYLLLGKIRASPPLRLKEVNFLCANWRQM